MEPTPEEVSTLSDTVTELEPDIFDGLKESLEFVGVLVHDDEVHKIGIEWGFASPAQIERLMNRLHDAHEADCRPCVHAVIYGWYGPPLLKDLNAHAHCNQCHRSWRGIKEAHCKVCHEQFSSAEAAGKHWVNDRHVHPSEVKGRDGTDRFCPVDDEHGFGVVWTLCRHQEAA
jgi:hypothetical protein